MKSDVRKKEMGEYRSIRKLLALDLSPSTQENYIRDIKKFMDFAKIEDIDEFLRLPSREIVEVLEDYVILMKEPASKQCQYTIPPNSDTTRNQSG